MNRFHVCKKVKSFILVALSVAILVTSVPFTSFQSHAVSAAGGYLGSLAVSEYMALVSYLLSRGYSAPRLYSEDGDYLVQNDGITGKAQSVLTSFENAIKAHDIVLGTKIMQALENSAKSGKLALTAEQDAFLRGYFESLTVSESLVVGTSTERFDPISADTQNVFSFDWIQNNSSVIHSDSISFSCSYDALPIIIYNFDGATLNAISIVFFTTESLTQSQANNAITLGSYPSSVFARTGSNSAYTTDGSFTPFVQFIFDNSNYGFSDFALPAFLIAIGLIDSQIRNIWEYFRLNGYYDASVDYTSTQVVDTSDTDVLTPANSIDSTTGEVEGGYTLYLPDMESLQETINDFTNGVISWVTALQQLGLAAVSGSATVAEKEAALSNVSIPDSTYLWITETTWGSTTINETVTNEVAQTQTQEGTIAEELAEQYSDNAPEEPSEEDKNKGGLAMLIATALLYLGLWDDPSTDPTDPDSGGIVGDPDDEDTVPWLVDTLTAIPEVSGILGDMFSSAGGTNGYGFVYTVGISFVLFSVIIGAGHFFGALGSEIQARSQENDIKADHEYNKQQAYKAYREGLISKHELYRMTRK